VKDAVQQRKLNRKILNPTRRRDSMKKIILLVMVSLLVLVAMPAKAAKVWDDMSWWGNTGAKPEPVADSQGRSGYWWWPKEAASNNNDSELWGNRGIVYSQWQKPEPPAPPAPTPPPPAPPVQKRTAPVFNHVLFDFDKSVLKPEGKVIVDEVIAYMKQYPNDKVTIEGHCCSIGTDEYNMGLGQRRADSVKKYMVDNGIVAARVTTISYGESRPAVPNDTPANRKLNRRAVFVITIGD